MTCRIRRGFTLVEILIACSIAVLVGLMGWAMLRPVLLTSSHAAEQTVLQQQALATSDALDADLRRTTPTAFAFQSGPTHVDLALIRLSDAPWAGSLQWEPFLVLYDWTPPRLERRTLWTRDGLPAWLAAQLAPGVQDPVLQDVTPLAAIHASGVTLLSDRMTRLQIDNTSPPRQFPFTLECTLQSPAWSTDRYQMVRSFTLRNWQ